MKAPKNLDKYISPVLAGARLINLALQEVLMLKPGIRVRWELTLRLYADDATMKELGCKVFPCGGKFSSGTEEK